jgi:flagellar motility protein MotE (MotC chaperone)
MKFLTSSMGIVILGAVLGLGTIAALLFAQRSVFSPPPLPAAPSLFWGFRTEEVESMVGELKREREQLDKRDADIDQTAAHIEAERQELEKVKASIQAMRDEIANEIPQLQEAELKNLKALAQTYAQMKPPAAVAIFREMDDVTVVKILSLMKPDDNSKILEEMSHTQDNDQTLVARAARISDKLRLVKLAKAQPAPTP